MSDDWHACAALVERGDADRFRAIMAAPAAARPVLFPIYALALEVARAPWITQEPVIAEMRLQWWRDALDEIAQGPQVRRHEVTTPLAAVLTKAGAEALDDLVLARRWDIYKDPFEDEAAFTSYLEHTAGVPLFAACDALGAADRDVCADAGFASGLARFLQAIPALEAHNRIPLLDGRAEAVGALARQGLSRLARARKGRRRVAAAPFLNLCDAEMILKQAAAAPERVKDGALAAPMFKSAARLSLAATTGRW